MNIRVKHYYIKYWVIQYRWWMFWRNVKTTLIFDDSSISYNNFPLLFDSFEAACQCAKQLSLPGALKEFYIQQDRIWREYKERERVKHKGWKREAYYSGVKQ